MNRALLCGCELRNTIFEFTAQRVGQFVEQRLDGIRVIKKLAPIAYGLGGGLDYFLRTVFNYPTLAECYKVAALDASNKLRF